MIPAVQLTDQQQPGTRTTLITEIGTGAIAIVDPDPILPAAHRAGSVLIGEEPHINPEQRQYLSPPALCSFNGVADHRRASIARAKAMSRDLTHARRAGLGGKGCVPS